jgi:zinc D-Ala-D-Ala carboxypeptidase
MGKRKVKIRRSALRGTFLLIFLGGFIFLMGQLYAQRIVENQGPTVAPESVQTSVVSVNNGQHLKKDVPWHLILVNREQKMPTQFEVPLASLDHGLEVDERILKDLQEMMKACEGKGLTPLICSAYRSYEKQEDLFEDKVQALMKEGFEREEAILETSRSIAFPGASEHQLGLAVDIVSLDNQNLSSKQEETKEQQWLMKNSYRYGFILRYPKNKEHVTGIIYEPWHYRYVWKEAALDIYEKGLCLEEYLESIDH